MEKSKDGFIKVKLERAKRLKIQKKFAEAEVEIREALEISPSDTHLLTSLADLYIREGKTSEAESLVNQILQKFPDHGEAAGLKGLLLLQEKKYDDAIEFLKLSLSKIKNNYFLSKLVQAEIAAKHYESAKQNCQSALEKNPDDPVWLSRLAFVFKKLDRKEEALLYYKKALLKDPTNEFAYKEYLELKSEGKPLEEVAEELKTILSCGRGTNLRLHLLRGETLEKEKKFDEAITEYETVLFQNPSDKFARSKLGFCLYRKGDIQRAREVFRESFLEDPSDHYIRNTLMSIYRREKNLTGLLALLEEARLKHPDKKPLWGLIAKVKKELITTETQKDEDTEKKKRLNT